jgi:hypothetical protein
MKSMHWKEHVRNLDPCKLKREPSSASRHTPDASNFLPEPWIISTFDSKPHPKMQLPIPPADSPAMEPEVAMNSSLDVDSQDQEQDMTMAEAGVEGEDVTEVKMEDAPIIKQEVKLENLFADVNDEEFSSSPGPDTPESSSPEPIM